MEGFQFEDVFPHGREVIVTVRHGHLFTNRKKALNAISVCNEINPKQS